MSLADLVNPPLVSAPEMARLQRSFEMVDRLTRQLEEAYRQLGRHEDEGHARSTAMRDEGIDGLIEAIPCGIVIAAAEGGIVRLNRAAERVLGRERAELVGRDVRTLVDHRGEPILLLGQDGTRPGATIERLVSCLDGSTRHLSGCVADLSGGERLEILADQTEVTHLRNQVHRLDTLAAMGEMAAGIAHEIRNPMSAVEGFAGLLEKALEQGERPEREVIERYTNRIRRGVAEVNSIINGLLMWARPEKALRESVDLVALVQEAAVGLGEDRRIDFSAAAPSVLVVGDPIKLKLAIGNLLRNAREAAGTEGQVRVRIQRAQKAWDVLVEDSGPGLAPEVRDRLFQPFTTNKPGGTGLGLALTRKFAELHGGSVMAQSSELGGAAFRLRLPVELSRGAMR